MSITLVFLALLMGAVVWWLVKQTINVTPWVADAATDSVRDEGVRSPFTSKPLSNMKLGLGVFLAVATSLFALFISAYSIRMEYPDWRPLTEPSLLWVNTGILVLSSVFLSGPGTARNAMNCRRSGAASLLAVHVRSHSSLANWPRGTNLHHPVTSLPATRQTDSFTCSPGYMACIC